jgi:hypothetical protein
MLLGLEEHMNPQASFNGPERPNFAQEHCYTETHMSHSRHMSMPDITMAHAQYNMSPHQVQHHQLTPAHTYSGPGFTPVQEFAPRIPTPAMPYDSQLVAIDHTHMENLMSGPFGVAGIPVNSPGQSDMLQYWLSQADKDMGYDSLTIPDMIGPSYTVDASNRPAHLPMNRVATSETSETASTGNIPNERFARVESCWLAKNNGIRSTLWHDVVHSPGPNLFSVGPSSSQEKLHGRWGVSAQLRCHLEAEFGSHVLHPAGASANGKTPRPGNFPPAEVLEICLDHYFRRFHPMAPFMHVPSFDASNTPLPLLYAMCMLGLSALESSNGGNFISNAFTVGIPSARYYYSW